jgi:6-phosphofructokinase 1
VPKTIDNDVPLTERSFGFATAVARAVEAISSAHCEAFPHKKGLALVKLMGRESGFIALEATIASGDVNLCLLPECEFDVEVILRFIENRFERRNHCVVVVAEGAGQKCFGGDKEKDHDVSGNVKLVDVGIALKNVFEKRLPGTKLTYIDPSYIIRSAPADPHDEEVSAGFW